MLVIDLMHEVEIGVWKAVFIQLLRLLEAVQKGTMNELDARWVDCFIHVARGDPSRVYFRYRRTPTFGRDTIRRFINNVSEMKQLAARDFEDLLQVCFLFTQGQILQR